MKSYKIAAGLMTLAGALTISTSPVRAQTGVAEGAGVAAPVIAKVASSLKPKPKAPGSEWLKAEVIHADANSIVVREPGNERMIHTFTISPQFKDKMQAIVDRGGYQYGDKVKILYQPGQTVALKISGKPSKPS